MAKPDFETNDSGTMKALTDKDLELQGLKEIIDSLKEVANDCRYSDEYLGNLVRSKIGGSNADI